MRQMVQRHIGLRAEGMILAAVVWLTIGLGVAFNLAPENPAAWHTLLPTPVRVTLWVGPALITLVTAASEKWSNWGIALLQLAPLVRIISYLLAWLFDLQPGPPPGDPAGWYHAATYVWMSAATLFLARIPADVRAPLTGRPR